MIEADGGREMGSKGKRGREREEREQEKELHAHTHSLTHTVTHTLQARPDVQVDG